ncbi:MAG TPA: DNA gyrase inhibitor YacG [Acetobacteraceae bacterium]|nr:DNA gyrase inhibitor YacG [Acetobacteraceae bacterium]
MNAQTFSAPGAGSGSRTGARGRCPVCGRRPDQATRPFCSVRCADVDLGRWLTGEYRIPAVATDEDPDQAAAPEPDPDAA